MSNERNVEIPRRAGSAWSALLEGELAERANDAIQDILSELATWDESLPNGLAGGTAGMALGYHTLARSLGDDSLLERARVAWEESAASLADSASSPAFYGGFPGVAFASAQVASELFGQDADDLLSDIDEPLGEFLSHSYVTGNYDLVSGLTGVGVYGLERMPSAAGRRILGAVVRQLMDQTEPEAGQPGRTWKTPGELLPPHQREMAPNGYYNLGVAHGAPAAVAVIAQAAALGVEAERARDVAEEVLDWIFAQEQPRAGATRFPSWVPVGGPRTEGSRLAWCYGDLGLSLALLLAARALGHEDYERRAVDVAENCASIAEADAGVRDFGLCHGSAGNALVFARLAHLSGRERLAEAAREWARYTLDHRRVGEPIGGYPAWTSHDRTGSPHDLSFLPEAGLLTGSLGVALALAAVTTDVDPAWDRFLVASPAI